MMKAENMNSVKNCHKALSCLVLLAMTITSTQAITLNFNAVISPGTCTFNLDKSNVSLGYVPKSEMKPSTLVAVQPFTLSVTHCSGAGAALTPSVHIAGEGSTLGGKWLFRQAESTANNTGIVLIKTDTPPAYSEPEVKDGDTFALTKVPGTTPTDQSHTFYAGLACGDTVSCSSVTTGKATARIIFSLDYR